MYIDSSEEEPEQPEPNLHPDSSEIVNSNRNIGNRNIENKNKKNHGFPYEK